MAAAPATRGATKYAHQSVKVPATSIGPTDAAGLSPAPLTGPVKRIAAASAEPIDSAATAWDARSSVATATTTRMSTKVPTVSAAASCTKSVPAAGDGAPRWTAERAWSPYKAQTTAAAAAA